LLSFYIKEAVKRAKVRKGACISLFLTFVRFWLIGELTCKGVGAREPHVGAKRAKHRAKRSPECGDPVGGTPKFH
jgi:hypothetical protein